MNNCIAPQTQTSATPMSVTDFQNSFDAAGGLEFQRSRAYWLGRCSELVYPVTEAEKQADRQAREARAVERALDPSWWRPWKKRASKADVERARRLAIAAVNGVVRTEALRIEREVKAWGFDRFQFMSGVSTQCFLAASDKLIVICFRGTEPNRIWDIYADLLAIPMRVPQVSGLVHVGFWTALQQVWTDVDSPPLIWPTDHEEDGTTKGIADYLRAFRCQQNPQLVWITGHSLGGALATIAAARLVREGVLGPDDIGGVYTFGQPRVGDLRFAEGYKIGDRHFRIVRDNDVVTRVPPESLRQVQAAVHLFIEYPSQQAIAEGISSFQYRHVGRVAALSDVAGISLDIRKWAMLVRRIAARFKALFRPGSFLERLMPGITDHSMSKYNKALAIAGADTGLMDSGPDKPGNWPENFTRLAIIGASAIGLLAGLVMGFFESPAIGMVSGGLASLSVLTLGLQDRFITQARALLIGTFGLVGVAGLLLGTYVRTF